MRSEIFDDLVRRRPDGVVGVATPPHVKTSWIFEEPLSSDDFINEMVRRGCTRVDAFDVSGESERSGFGYM